MSTTQAEAAQADLADLIDLDTEVSCPATRAALDAWLSTVLPATPRQATPAAVSLAAPRSTYTVGRSASTAGLLAATASILAVGWTLAAAIAALAGA